MADSSQLEWLALVEVSGPFLAGPVLENAFPQGLESVATPIRQRIRAAYEEWRDAVEQDDPLLPQLHAEWIRLVLTELLDFDSDSLVRSGPDGMSAAVEYEANEPSILAPTWVVRSPSSGESMLLVVAVPSNTDLGADGHATNRAGLYERVTSLCRARNVRVGLLTNGEQWVVINAPMESISGQASWYARYWFQEPVTLRAFKSLLNVRRCFGPAEFTLDALLEVSTKHQDHVTDTLGEQVRRAVEVLIQAIDRADEDRNRDLLLGVTPATLYEAGLTVMMRLVFILCAEERGLLLLGDPVYDQSYAVSTLRGQLADEADRHGHEVLERRQDAWSRLLALFRGVFGGIEHENLHLPAMGGSLFDPDRFRFLEGRAPGTDWRETPSAPLPIDNRTVLLLLNALQVLEQPNGALLLSYRALDVEQIGYVYEGLLEQAVLRVPHTTLGLKGSTKRPLPNVSLSTIESTLIDGESELVEYLIEATGRTASAIRKDLTRTFADQSGAGELVIACSGSSELVQRVLPFASLLRTDAWGQPIIYGPGAFIVGASADRREQGTHYTSRSLTEQLVSSVVGPIVESREKLRLSGLGDGLLDPAGLLGIRICDPAMGSGAFLVQACRYLSERLILAWRAAEEAGVKFDAHGLVVGDSWPFDPLSPDQEERRGLAYRLVAENCLYGVDINPLAVELAKLSMWLITLAKGKPFGFLDHNLRAGDSLLGLHHLAQVEQLTMDPADGRAIQPSMFQLAVESAVSEAVTLRKALRQIRVMDIHDVERMNALNDDAQECTSQVSLLADHVIGITLKRGSPRALAATLDQLALDAGSILGGDADHRMRAEGAANGLLRATTQDGGTVQRDPFHWALEFPEVFDEEHDGFDAVVTNPPYVSFYGRDSMLGSASAKEFARFALSHIATIDENAVMTGRVNTFLLFLTRAVQLAPSGRVGMVLPDTIITNESYTPMRIALTESGRVRQVTQFEAPQFRNATVGTALVVLGERQDGGTLRLRFVSDDGAVRTVTESTSGVLSRSNCSWLPVSTLEIEGKGLPEGTSVALEEFSHVRDGINPGSKETRMKLITDCDDGDPALRLCIEGKWITPFAIDIRNLWVRYAPERLSKEDRKAGASLGKQWIWDSRKIVYRQTAPYIIAAVDSEGLAARNSVHSIVLHEPDDDLMYALCAYLNSTPFRQYYQSETGETRKVFPQVHVSSVKKLRVPRSLLETSSEDTKRLAALARSVSSMSSVAASTQSHDAVSRVLAEVDSIVERLVANARNFSGGSLPQPAGSTSASGVIRQPPTGLTRRAPDARAEVLDASAQILRFLTDDGGWHSKAEIVRGAHIDDSRWNAAVNVLLSRDQVERTGTKRGARYRMWAGLRGAQID